MLLKGYSNEDPARHFFEQNLIFLFLIHWDDWNELLFGKFLEVEAA